MLCPLEASWLVTEPGDIASALISQLDRRLAGEPVAPIFFWEPLGTQKRES